MIEYKINNEILKLQLQNVMVVDTNGNSLGMMNPRSALYKARDNNLDLVLIAPKAATPVCKIMDYGKFKYDQQKKEKLTKRNQQNTEVSEIQLTYTIQEHDMETKAKTAKRLIEEKGNDVRIVLRLRGREASLKDYAKDKVVHFIELCREFAKVKKEIFIEGRDIKAILCKK